MRSKLLPNRVQALALVVVSFFPAGGPYRVDDGTHVPVRYDSFAPPPAGRSYEDPAFRSQVTRLSDALATPDSAGSGMLEFVINEYATVSPFSSDGSWLLLQHQSYFALYTASGEYLRDLPLEISASTEPRWSREHPERLYYLVGNEIRSHDVITGTTALVRAFPEYLFIEGSGEADVGFNDDRFVLGGNRLEIFVFDVTAMEKGPTLLTGLNGFDGLALTPDDHVIVSWLSSGTDRFQGVELFDADMNFLRQLTPAAGHMDVTRDDNGEEVLVWMNAGDPTPVCENGVVKVRLSDAQESCLLSLDWGLAAHVSASDDGPWVHVSTYGPSDPDPDTSEWTSYTNEILLVRLDGSETRRLAHHRSRPLNDYNYTPRAAVDRSGSLLVFSSNHGLEANRSEDYSDAYLIDLRLRPFRSFIAALPHASPALLTP